MTHQIVRIRVKGAYESCERWTYYVDLESEEGFEKTVDSHRTGSTYNNFAGLSRREARDRALIDAATWGDFLGLVPDTFTEDDIVYHPSTVFNFYETRRELRRRKQAAG